ncbi:hypothetical protein D9619_010894 [Psilocybe cf. subviscida]|uniref:NAD(P)-binding protein n=1 Tax=Psilocybe cf. subviscida TaxID=2480587 RepID=A0A8H5B8M5_9AGAR|nr:hypothetical protein D9619_010894 [Psilocybe cf. subviscida]
MSKSNITDQDLVDLKGKVAIVTGGNSGVGYGTVQWLARQGAKVYIAGRNDERVAAAIKKLESEGLKGGSLHALKLDLADPRLAKQSAEDFLTKESRLDILVNNAAIGGADPTSLNQYGLRDIITTKKHTISHISHFVFTETLLPLLKKTAQEENSDVRIINVSSKVHDTIEVDSFKGKETLNKNYGDSMNDKMKTYSFSKLANILHIKHLQKQFDSENIPITCIALHPGVVATPGMDKFFDSVGVLGRVLKVVFVPLFLLSISKGGMNSAFAAASQDIKKDRAPYKGAYLMPVGKITQPSKAALDDRLASELYDTTKEVLSEIGL